MSQCSMLPMGHPTPSESLFKTLVEHAPAALAILDRAGRYMIASRRWITEFNLGTRDLSGRFCFEVFPKSARKWKERCLAESVEKHQNVLFQRSDGTTEYRDWELRPWRDASGGIGGIVVISELSADQSPSRERVRPSRSVNTTPDIANGREATGAFRLSVEHFHWVQQTAKIGTFEWDLKTNTVRWVAEVPSLAGLAKDGRFESWAALLTPNDKARLAVFVDRIKLGEQQFEEFALTRPDGKLISLYAGGKAILGSDGMPTHIVGIAMDITERKLAEDALRKTEKLAAAGRLAAAMAHEVNNPLEAVTNLLYLALSNATLEPEARVYLMRADEELKRVAHIVRQTLGFYRESSSPQLTNISELVRGVLDLYQKKFQAKQIHLTMSLDTAIQLEVLPSAIRQVIANLLSNAVDAVAEGGGIDVLLQRQGDEVQLAIRDNGPGIAPENEEHLFEPFFTTKQEAGTGLGLWVSKGLVERHGGKISLTTSTDPSNHGTAFLVSLPIP